MPPNTPNSNTNTSSSTTTNNQSSDDPEVFLYEITLSISTVTNNTNPRPTVPNNTSASSTVPNNIVCASNRICKQHKMKKKKRSTASPLDNTQDNQDDCHQGNQGPSDSNSNNNNSLAAVNNTTNADVVPLTLVTEDWLDKLLNYADSSSQNPPDAELDRKQDESMAESLLEFNPLGQDSYINPIAKEPNLGINEHPLATLTNFEETILGESNPLTYGFLSQMVFVEDKLLPYASTSSESYEVACAGGEGQPPYPVNIPRMLGNGPSLVDLRLPSNVIEYVLELLRTSSSPGSIFLEKFSQSEKDEKEAKDFGIYNPRHDDQQDKKDDDYDYNLN